MSPFEDRSGQALPILEWEAMLTLNHSLRLWETNRVPALALIFPVGTHACGERSPLWSHLQGANVKRKDRMRTLIFFPNFTLSLMENTRNSPSALEEAHAVLEGMDVDSERKII